LDQGEDLVETLLVDDPSTHVKGEAVTTTSGSRGQSKGSSDPEAVVSTSNTPKSSSSKFELVLVSKEVKDSFCCGLIASIKNDYACARDGDSCKITSHSKKHVEVKDNHMYILMYNQSSPDTSRRLFNPTELKEPVHENDLITVFNKIVLANVDLDTIDAGIDDAIQAFKKIISELIEAKYTNLSVIHSSNSDQDNNEISDPVFDFENDIEEMMTARDLLDSSEDKEVTDKKPSLTVDPDSANLNTPQDPLVDTLIESSKSSVSKRIARSQVGKGRRNPVFSRVSTAIPHRNLTSEQFVQKLATSDDQGVSVMKSFYQKVLDLDQYSKEVLLKKIDEVTSVTKSLDDSIELLLHPKSILPRLQSVELAIDAHDESIDEFFDTVQSEIDRKLGLKLDLIWDQFKPNVAREITRINNRNRLGQSERRDNVSLDNGKFDALQSAFNKLKDRHSSMDIEGKALKREVQDLRGLVSNLVTKMENLELKCVSLENQNSPSSSASGIAPSLSVHADGNDRLAKIEYQMTLVESRMGQSVLDFGSVTLQSYQDTCLFTNDKIKSNSFGCFFDLMALLNSPRDTNTDEKTFLESLYNAQKTKFISISEVSTSTSFLHVTPLCFCKASQQDSSLIHGSIDKMLPLVRKRHQWSQQGGVFGIKRSLEMNILSKVNSLEHEIRDTLGDTEGATLAREYLRASYACFNDFINWTENFFNELIAMKSVSDTEAWNLILECWMAFFIELRKVRMECSSLSLAGLDVTSVRRKEIVSHYIWTMGKAIKLQNDFRDKQFRNHPSISAVINYYLFQHKVSLSTYNTTIDKIKDDVKHLNSWRTTATRDITKCLNK
jgi:hypothetical protein